MGKLKVVLLCDLFFPYDAFSVVKSQLTEEYLMYHICALRYWKVSSCPGFWQSSFHMTNLSMDLIA